MVNYTALRWARGTGSSLSIIGAAIVVIRVRKRTETVRCMILILSLCDLLSAANYLWESISTNEGDSLLCDVQALVSIFFPCASFLWTVCISATMWWVAQGRAPGPRFVLACHGLCWGVPAVLVTVVASFGAEGYDVFSGGWCWINAEAAAEGALWPLVGGKGC